jgi:hypothetical protein
MVLAGPSLFACASRADNPQTEMEKLAGSYWNATTQEVWRIAPVDGKLMTGTSPEALVALGGGRFRLGDTADLKFSVSTTVATLEVRGIPPMLKLRMFTRVAAPVYSNADLQAYAGEYRNDDLEARFTITVAPAQRLSLSRRKFEPQLLDPVKLDVFTSRVLGTMTFARAPSGNVVGLTNTEGQTRGVSFTRVDRSSTKK